jgi:hypothetical protein
MRPGRAAGSAGADETKLYKQGETAGKLRERIDRAKELIARKKYRPEVQCLRMRA